MALGTVTQFLFGTKIWLITALLLTYYNHNFNISNYDINRIINHINSDFY